MMWYRMKPKFTLASDNRMFLARNDKAAIEYIRSSTDSPNDYILEEVVDNNPIRRIAMGIKPMTKAEQQRAAERFEKNKGE